MIAGTGCPPRWMRRGTKHDRAVCTPSSRGARRCRPRATRPKARVNASAPAASVRIPGATDSVGRITPRISSSNTADTKSAVYQNSRLAAPRPRTLAVPRMAVSTRNSMDASTPWTRRLAPTPAAEASAPMNQARVP